MSGIRIALRYAKSLLDLSTERNQLDAVQADMKLMALVMKENRDLVIMLSSPVVKADKKISILTQIFSGKISELTLGFITLMANKGRESLLPEIVESFNTQLMTQRGIGKAEVTSAIKLDDASRAKVLEAAMKMAGGNVELTEKVDTALIGGFILKVGDKQVDNSVATTINNLKREFADNPYIPEI